MLEFNDRKEWGQYGGIQGWETALDVVEDGWKALYDCTKDDMVGCGGCGGCGIGIIQLSACWFAEIGNVDCEALQA